MDDDASAIPAATVQDVDLSGISEASAAEIRRLGQLMEEGEETSEQFTQLVRLLYEAGFHAKSEYLLRRNIDSAVDGTALYRELHGTTKPDEFAAAIDAFANQFSVDLALEVQHGFLDRLYRTMPRLARFDELRLLSEPCEIRFNFANEEAVEADVSSLEDENYVILHWINGVWEVVGGSSG